MYDPQNEMDFSCQLIPPSRNGRLVRTVPGAFNPMSVSMPLYGGEQKTKQATRFEPH
jgi:hypothetical protein